MKNKSNKLSVTSWCRSVVCGAPSLAPHSLPLHTKKAPRTETV